MCTFLRYMWLQQLFLKFKKCNVLLFTVMWYIYIYLAANLTELFVDLCTTHLYTPGIQTQNVYPHARISQIYHYFYTL